VKAFRGESKQRPGHNRLVERVRPMLSCNQLKVGRDGRDNNRGKLGAEVLLLRVKSSFLEREREDTRITSKRLMITRLKTYKWAEANIYTRQLDKSGGQRPVAQTKRKKVRAKVEACKWITRWKEQ